MTTQRLIRVLVYEGSPEQIAAVLKNRWVKGSYKLEHLLIREAILGDFLETFDKPQPEKETS
jgi:hypothetical protein